MKSAFRTALLSLAAILTCTAHAVATPFSISDFGRVSDAELLNPRFDVAGGQRSARAYAGYVEVIVSGSGFNNVNLPIFKTDSFYDFDPATLEEVFRTTEFGLFSSLDGSSLRIGFESKFHPLPGEVLGVGLPYTFKPNCSLRLECTALHVADLIVAVEGDSVAMPFGVDPLDIDEGFVPVYSKDHRYHFVMDLGSYSGTLTMGYGDGGASDNSPDTYDIELYQVRLLPKPPKAVAEPGALSITAIGLVALGFVRRRWREQSAAGGDQPPAAPVA